MLLSARMFSFREIICTAIPFHPLGQQTSFILFWISIPVRIRRPGSSLCRVYSLSYTPDTDNAVVQTRRAHKDGNSSGWFKDGLIMEWHSVICIQHPLITGDLCAITSLFQSTVPSRVIIPFERELSGPEIPE